MYVKVITVFLIFMSVLALFGRLRFPKKTMMHFKKQKDSQGDKTHRSKRND